jgi:hypothetical protein
MHPEWAALGMNARDGTIKVMSRKTESAGEDRDEMN